MTTYSLKCILLSEQFNVVQKLCDNAFSFGRNYQIYYKRGREYTSIEGENIILLQHIIKYILSAYSVYNETVIKSIPIDYEYIDENLKIIKNIYDKLNGYKTYSVDYYVGKEKVDVRDPKIPLFLCEQRWKLKNGEL